MKRQRKRDTGSVDVEEERGENSERKEKQRKSQSNREIEPQRDRATDRQGRLNNAIDTGIEPSHACSAITTSDNTYALSALNTHSTMYATSIFEAWQ